MPNTSSRSANVSWPTRTREDILASIRAALPGLREALPVVRVVLFGSYTTDRATVASDVDLLVVYEGASREDAFATIKKAIPVRGLEPHAYTVEEAAKQQDLLARMTRDGIVVWERDA